MKEQRIVDQLARLIDGRCPFHGISLAQTNVHSFHNPGPVANCPRRDCGGLWVGPLPTGADLLLYVAQRIRRGMPIAVTARSPVDGLPRTREVKYDQSVLGEGDAGVDDGMTETELTTPPEWKP